VRHSQSSSLLYPSRLRRGERGIAEKEKKKRSSNRKLQEVAFARSRAHFGITQEEKRKSQAEGNPPPAKEKEKRREEGCIEVG